MSHQGGDPSTWPGTPQLLSQNKYNGTNSNNIQIMTDHEDNRKIYLARGIQEGLETVDYCPILILPDIKIITINTTDCLILK